MDACDTSRRRPGAAVSNAVPGGDYSCKAASEAASAEAGPIMQCIVGAET